MAITAKQAELFDKKAGWIVGLLMQDFREWDVDDAAACVGNLGHECAGFKLLQEQKPVVAGSAGGYGWPQWTGPRRRAYFAYCERNKLDPASDVANYKYLFVELKGYEGTEAKTVRAVAQAVGLRNKVIAFEKNFERAGVKHYDSRYAWALRALEVYRKWNGVYPSWVTTPGVLPPVPPPLVEPPSIAPETNTWKWGVGAITVLVLILLAVVGANQ